MFLSTIRFATALSSLSCGMVSKYFVMSASITCVFLHREVEVHLVHRLVGVSSRSEAIGTFLKVCLEYGFDDELDRHLDYPVLDRGYPKRSFAPIRFGDIDPPYRHGLVRFVS